MIEVLDTYYMHVAAKLATYDSTQKMGGVVDARDWPQTAPVEGAIYLLFLQGTPTGGTESQNLFEYLCQWVWILIGANLPNTSIGANRGDRYRQNLKIMGNLRQANFPSYCPKSSYSASAQTGAVVAAPMTAQSVWWSKLKFAPRLDTPAGLIYGAASVRVYAYEDVAAAVNS